MWGRQRPDPRLATPDWNTKGSGRSPREKRQLRDRRLGILRARQRDPNRRPLRALSCPSARSRSQVTSLSLRRAAGEKKNSPLRSLLLTVLAASAQVLPFFLRPFSLMSGLELTRRLPCPGSGCLLLPAAPCTAFPAVPGKGGRKGKSDRRSNSAEERQRRSAVGRGGREVYGAAGPAAVATANAAAILGSYCTGSRCSHVTAPARPSLLYAAHRANERALARAPGLSARAGCLERFAPPLHFRSRDLLGRMRVTGRASRSLWVGFWRCQPTAKTCRRKRKPLLPRKAI